MSLNLRKFVVGLLALSALAGVFLLYLHLNRTAPIIVEAAESAPLPSPAVEVNETGAPESVGTIMEVGIGPVRQTRFQHRNAFNQIDREFGFEELLHEQGKQWHITKPYMRLYLDKFICRVTANRGNVQIDDAFGRPMPTDAMFIGNVVIHVLPTDPNDPWECFIHLDDVGFVAEKSLFSSTGAVQFLSRFVRLTGTGMELLYDTPRSRLEMFRVFDLDSLRIRSSELKAVAGEGSSDSERQSDPAVAKDSATEPSAVGRSERTPAPADPNAPPADMYRCVFRKNVRLKSPDGVVVARDRLSINNIQWAAPDAPEPRAEQSADPNGPKALPLPSPNALNTAASSHPALSSIPEELYDIVITCDGGADITLRGDQPEPAEPVATGASATASAEAAPPEFDSSDPQQMMARRIDFDYSTKDTTMLGPVAMRFLVDPNSLGEKAGGELMPMEVTAQGSVRFLAASERIVLEGGATATLHKSEPNSSDEYRLAAPRLTLDLAIDANAPDNVRVDVRKFVADAGSAPPDVNDSAVAPPVAVRMRRLAAGKPLGWAALDARALQYDKDLGQLTAAGPGMIWLHNAATIRSKDDPNSMFEPCYARLSNFDTLKYWSLSNRIVAEDDSQQLVLDYFPLVGDKYGPQTQVVAGHVEAMLQEITKGRMDLVSLVASQGIEYDNEVDHSNFVGSEMVYDRVKSLVTIRGDDMRPCYFNGALVDEIVINPQTGEAEAEFPTASVIQVRQ